MLDAEWRFEQIKQMASDLGANKRIRKSLFVGIPHIDIEYKRGQDLTFSHSRMGYAGTPADSSWYIKKNSEGGMAFYIYLTKELIPDLNKHYSTNDHETLIGHSYGAYFLGLDHPFEVIHMYDPSIWYGNGEVIERFKNWKYNRKMKGHLTYQSEPAFHKNKIEEFIALLEAIDQLELSVKFYEGDTHNSLYLDSFYKGILHTNQ